MHTSMHFPVIGLNSSNSRYIFVYEQPQYLAHHVLFSMHVSFNYHNFSSSCLCHNEPRNFGWHHWKLCGSWYSVCCACFPRLFLSQTHAQSHRRWGTKSPQFMVQAHRVGYFCATVGSWLCSFGNMESHIAGSSRLICKNEMYLWDVFCISSMKIVVIIIIMDFIVI